MTLQTMKSAEQTSKQLYVAAIRGLRTLAQGTGLLGWLRTKSQTSRNAHWVLSLFHIHDIDGLLRLDVPWWTYDAIDKTDAFLKSRDQARVFEYGSGASTIWLARRASEVISVEHDSRWFPVVSEKLAALGRGINVDYRQIGPEAKSDAVEVGYGSAKPGYEASTFKAYATSILAEEGTFDLIVIDGRAREACLRHAVDKLKSDGVIVFDNSHRRRYRKAIDTCDLASEILKGRTPSLPYPDETTLLRPRQP